MRWQRLIPVVLTVALTLAPVIARGDSKIESTRPREGATLSKVPTKVVVKVTQRASDARLTVTDGCGDRVSKRTAIKGETISVRLRDAEPGRWKVRFQSVSAVDDHILEDSFTFRVRGPADCSSDEDGVANQTPSPSPTTSDDNQPSATGDNGQATGGTNDQDGSPPLLTLALVGVAIVLAAGVLLRRRGLG